VTGGGAAAAGGGLSPQPDKVTASSMISSLRSRNERLVTVWANRSDFSAALNSISSALSTAINRGDHNRRQHQDETGQQSVQEPAGIKQNRYASAMPGSQTHLHGPMLLE
jgi:hypothetical protein